jgi:putative glutamine amidotransferase
MKKILITQRLAENDTYFEQREMLDISWGKLFNQIGFLPIILPYEYDFEKYFFELDIHGVLLTGGNDLSILHDNELSFKRDTFEKKLIKYCIDNNIPIFGICRGMQIIADYFNSSFKKVDNQVNIRHRLVVNKNSKYLNLLDKLDNVNSFHNYVIDNFTDDFIISATNEDNMIKAIEHRSHKIFGCMWHSEREVPFDIKQLDLIKGFFS